MNQTRKSLYMHYGHAVITLGKQVPERHNEPFIMMVQVLVKKNKQLREHNYTAMQEK